MEKFFESGIITKYIKQFLAKTPLPLYNTIQTGDYIIQGCKYIYKHDIIECTKSGKFKGPNSQEYIEDYLYANDMLRVTDSPFELQHLIHTSGNVPAPEYGNEKYDGFYYLYDEPVSVGPYTTYRKPVTENPPLTTNAGHLTPTDDYVRYKNNDYGEYKVIGFYDFGSYIPNVSETFVSNTGYYDYATHKALGKYLRCLRDIVGLDLMSLYNCFSCYTTERFHLKENADEYIVQQKDSKSVVYLVPIKFNRVYSIAIDSNVPVLVKGVIYDGRSLVKQPGTKTLLSDLLSDTLEKYNNTQYFHPISHIVTNSSRDLQEYENYLYLAIQVSPQCKSSIVVLEGDYTSQADKYIFNYAALDKLTETQISNVFKTKLSLLDYNDLEQHPFADRLVEYILHNTIDVREYIDNNVQRIEDEINYSPRLKNFYKGMWDLDLRYTLYSRYTSLPPSELVNTRDILGYVDKDVESACSKGLLTDGD